jgi:hypothetical protein
VSVKHPIIVITGSSGAGTSTVRTTFEEIFRREGVTPAIVEGDAFHRYDRENMQQKMIEKQRQGYANFSHFGPEANLFEELEALFREYGERGCGKVRRYLHNEEDARPQIDNGRDSSRVVVAWRRYTIASRHLRRLGAQEDTLNLRPAKIEADPQSALTRVAGHARLSWLSK